jgi:hypothetical protein
MELILLAKTPSQLTEYYAKYELPNPADPTAPQIRLQEGRPSFKNIETNAILLLCLHQERSLVMDLLTQVFTTNHQTKFVLFSLPHNMAMRNREKTYSNLLKQQTLLSIANT